MTEPLLRVEGLKTWIETRRPAVRAVDGLSFEIQRGETFALLGESGCGKSMTALTLMRLIPEPVARIVDGSVWLNGQDLLTLPEVAMRRVRGRRMAMIFQEPQTSLNPVLTVGDQIREVLKRHQRLKGLAVRQRVLELLDEVGIPDPLRRYDEYPHQLSGGMKQRLMIAMALAGRPELLIADEPTTALDVTIQAQILDLLRHLQQETHMAILLITHDLGVVAKMADRVAVMYAGQLVEQAKRSAFFAEPSHPYSRKLFAALPRKTKRTWPLAVIRGTVPALDQEFSGCRFAERCELAWQLCREQPPTWWGNQGMSEVRCHLYNPRVMAKPVGDAVALPTARPIVPCRSILEEALLRVKGLKVYFPLRKGLFKRVVGHVRAVDGVSLDVPGGHTLALVGESGCGKTTVGKGILQLLQPTAGNVLFNGTDLTRLTPRQMRAQRADLQIVFQDAYASMNPRMRITDLIEEGMLAQGIGRSREERRQRIDQLLHQVGLSSAVRHRYPHEFSGGQRQRVCIARALAVNPRVIICDEPTSALDVSVQAQILNLLQALQQRLGLAYLFITHNIAVVEYLAHEVAVMYLGRIVEFGPADEVLSGPRHPYTQALLSAVPVVDPKGRREVIRLEGDLPSPVTPPHGCYFNPRCPKAMPLCRERYPDVIPISATHSIRCFLYSG